MPFKSQAQRRKFTHLLVEGKISSESSKNGIGRPEAQNSPNTSLKRQRSPDTGRPAAGGHRSRRGERIVMSPAKAGFLILTAALTVVVCLPLSAQTAASTPHALVARFYALCIKHHVAGR